MNILSFFACFETLVASVTIRQLTVIGQAILTMTGRITMLPISRWADKGGSYRSIQRFFSTVLPWNEMFARFFETHLFNPEHEYIVAGDETVISKAGRETFGVDRFFSGLQGKVISGLSFFVLSLVDTAERRSYPLAVAQTIKSETEKQALKSRKKRQTKKPKAAKGRRKGSLKRDKNELRLSPELLRISELLSFLRKLTKPFMKLKYLAMDGHFGHNQAVLMAQANGFELISKLRKDAALYEKYEGTYGGRGAPKKYGARLKYDLIPVKYLRKSEREKEIITRLLSRTVLAQRVRQRVECRNDRENQLENQESGTCDIVQQ